jgi:hypothetical protein
MLGLAIVNRRKGSLTVDGNGSGHSAGRVLAACLLYAAVHSALAASPAKSLVERTAGSRSRNGLYRLLYNAQAVGLLVVAYRWFVRQPDREIYAVGRPWSRIFRLGQLLSLGLLGSGVRVVGLGRFSGIPQAISLLAGGEPGPEPEAQGPPIGSDGRIVRKGAFRITRHPSNWGFAGALLLFPRMTANRAVVALFAIAYALLGNLHEEHRLKQAYGEAYERYKREAPFFCSFGRGR